MNWLERLKQKELEYSESPWMEGLGPIILLLGLSILMAFLITILVLAAMQC
jgi:hypothetical protein